MARFKLLFSSFILIFLVVLPILVRAECTCDAEDEDRDKGKAMRYKITALVSILIASAIGVCIPLLGKVIPALSPEKDIFFIIKAFAAGVILATGFIHVLPDAFENLTSPCLKEHPWGDFPFTGFVAMCTAMGTLMVDTYATAYFQKHHSKEIHSENGDVEKEAGHEGTCIFTRMQRMAMLMALFTPMITPPSFFAIESYHRYSSLLDLNNLRCQLIDT